MNLIKMKQRTIDYHLYSVDVETLQAILQQPDEQIGLLGAKLWLSCPESLAVVDTPCDGLYTTYQCLYNGPTVTHCQIAFLIFLLLDEI